jgi:hypothetical protein
VEVVDRRGQAHPQDVRDLVRRRGIVIAVQRRVVSDRNSPSVPTRSIIRSISEAISRHLR